MAANPWRRRFAIATTSVLNQEGRSHPRESFRTEMEPTERPRVKVCCISSVEEAWVAIRLGASALGLVSDMPSGPGVIPESLIKDIASIVPPSVSSFLLTSKQEVPAIIEQHRHCRTTTIQLCDRLRSGNYADLKHALPGIAIVQVIHVTGPASIEEAISVAPYVDALLLDSGNQRLPVKELGGTGRTHDWSISRQIRERLPAPVFLAGGLNSQNIVAAVREVAPFGLDVCSGVRTDNTLDARKLTDLFSALRNTENESSR